MISKWAKVYRNLIWKSPGFVPFGDNLTHFAAKPTIPGELLGVGHYNFTEETTLLYRLERWRHDITLYTCWRDKITPRMRFRHYSTDWKDKITLKTRETTLLCRLGRRHYSAVCRHWHNRPGNCCSRLNSLKVGWPTKPHSCHNLFRRISRQASLWQKKAIWRIGIRKM